MSNENAHALIEQDLLAQLEHERENVAKLRSDSESLESQLAKAQEDLKSEQKSHQAALE